MRKIIVFMVGCIAGFAVYAQELQEIKLNTPDKTRGSVMMKALNDRQSVREYDTKALSLQDLSDLLWAANGVNRPDGRRTAATASNRQEIDVYAVLAEGAYFYDAQAHTLKPVAKGDYRGLVAMSQEFAKTAPVCLVIVMNLEKMGDPAAEQTKLMCAVDAGIVCQNINLFCAAVGLSTVPRATMDRAELQKVLKLNATQMPIMNNPVGYKKN